MEATLWSWRQKFLFAGISIMSWQFCTSTQDSRVQIAQEPQSFGLDAPRQNQSVLKLWCLDQEFETWQYRDSGANNCGIRELKPYLTGAIRFVCFPLCSIFTKKVYVYIYIVIPNDLFCLKGWPSAGDFAWGWTSQRMMTGSSDYLWYSFISRWSQMGTKSCKKSTCQNIKCY